MIVMRRAVYVILLVIVGAASIIGIVGLSLTVIYPSCGFADIINQS